MAHGRPHWDVIPRAVDEGVSRFRDALGGVGDFVTRNAADPRDPSSFDPSQSPFGQVPGLPAGPLHPFGFLGGGGSAAEETPQASLRGLDQPGQQEIPGFDELMGRAGVSGGGGGAGAGGLGALQNASAQLAAGYQQQVNQLREMYQFAETPDEKARIQFLLNDLEEQTDAARTIISDVYDAAIGDVSAREGDVREGAEEAAGRRQEQFQEAAERTEGRIEEAMERGAERGAGLGVGAQAATGDATDFIHLLETAAPREAALDERIGTIAADDLGHLAATMGAESPAQRAELERQANRMRTGLQAEHDRRVQDRIQQERMAYAQQAGQLGGQALGHQASLAGQAAQLATQLAQQRSGQRHSYDQMRLQHEMDRALQQQEPRPFDWTQEGLVTGTGLIQQNEFLRALAGQGALGPEWAQVVGMLDFGEGG